MSEPAPEYVTDALEMLYNQPTVVVEPPRKVVIRRDGRMIEEEEPAWVKFSTDFKKELKHLDVYSLKVFIYIGLSVNWQSGTAWPGVRKIATDTAIDKDTVAKAVTELEEKRFLTVSKRDGASNVYRPIRYISIGTVRPEGTVPSDESGKPSDFDAKPSDAQEGILHNKNNKIKPELLSQIEKQANKTVDAILQASASPKAIQDAMAKFFKLTPRWEGNKFNREWMQWAIEQGITPEQIEKAADKWRMDKGFNWRPPDLKAIQEKWLMLVDSDKASNLQIHTDENGIPETY